MQDFHPNDITVQLNTITNVFEVHNEKSWFYNPEKQQKLMRPKNPDYSYYHLLYILEGSYWHRFADQEKRLIPTGSLSLLQIQDNDFLNTSCELPMRYITIAFCTWTEIPLDFTRGNITVLPDESADMEAKFRAALQIIEEKNFAWRMKLKNITTEVLMHFFAAYYAREMNGSIPKLLDKSIRIIRQEIFTNPLTVNDIADRCGITTAYLIRIFNQHMGMTPKKYIDEVRLSRACDLLKYTDQSIEQIAVLSGFPEPRHLRRALEAKTGLTPREYRHQM